jgi:hypothetical protein
MSDDRDEIYVIVITGYEGIEHVMWAGAGKDSTREKVLDIRKRMQEVSTLPDDERHELPWPWGSYGFGDDPDFVCVMQQGDEEYECCCDELAVNPSKTMLR